ncbi:siderophore-interacting protein [Algibacter amylolyticus]|uniref:Siderophore-interacting protein n=1 Tax=Algibacter amylolyticus TaxID=1608400 RepID=A0A5M7B8R5_9FLAO|nr:SIP domain-containing protein [Algibacter amylolyticus]KAA5823791.1 siderophore-interacting protein [Algibacter amylolyticus]MBB5267964.1 NADPH-dependent ferric siderophore reductase [Algibacter amylolyticus]TSJ74279.1 siderophore-interacting protein [Algibacter amylolyticus]
MSLIENILKKVILEEAVISKKDMLSPSVFKIQLKSDAIKKTEFKPGYFLRLGIGIGNDNLTLKDKVRSYSVWNINKAEGTLDLAIATESKGIGAKWVGDVKVGDFVYFKWKKGNFLLNDDADSYLMIGDLSALSHLYILNRNLPDNKQVESLIYSEDINDLFADCDGSKPFNFHSLKQNSTKEILSLAKDIIPKMKGDKMVYIAGDSRVCLALNQYLRKELNWNTKRINIKPFWNPEKKGLE